METLRFTVDCKNANEVFEGMLKMGYDVPDPNASSNLTHVLLSSDYWKNKHRLVDFTGTTIREAIEKILTFYRHKTYRRGVGDHVFYEGIHPTEHGVVMVVLGS